MRLIFAAAAGLLLAAPAFAAAQHSAGGPAAPAPALAPSSAHLTSAEGAGALIEAHHRSGRGHHNRGKGSSKGRHGFSGHGHHDRGYSGHRFHGQGYRHQGPHFHDRIYRGHRYRGYDYGYYGGRSGIHIHCPAPRIVYHRINVHPGRAAPRWIV
ncbi:MAG: hypothetical protein MI723_05070, partial [Caulobacterales bacterium]|nr:hypothetical protein [Caulobacterales bacterium]